MNIDASFLFGKALVNSLNDLIRNSNKDLLLVSPYVNLHAETKEALLTKISLPEFKLRVLFGKNENNILKSIDEESLAFFKEFPNVEIRHNHRLHAKFYLNDNDYLLSSLNLYNYSMKDNIECGILVRHKAKGMLKRFEDKGDEAIMKGVKVLKKELLNIDDKEDDPIVKMNEYFNQSTLLYQSEGEFAKAKGLRNILSDKKLSHTNVKIDVLKEVMDNSKPQSLNKNIRLISITKFSKQLGVKREEIIQILEADGLIKGSDVLIKGTQMGLKMKIFKGNNYIAIPENIEALNILKKK